MKDSDVMTYFSEDDTSDNLNKHPYSYKKTPVMKPVTLSKEQAYPSLQDYIKQQLKTLDPESSHTESLEQAEDEGRSAQGGVVINPFGQAVTHDKKKLDGIYLDCLDVELPAGLEQFLPTEIFRLRVQKKRLEQEIGVLKQILLRCQKLATLTPSTVSRIARIKEHLYVLERKNRSIAIELSESAQFGSVLKKIMAVFSLITQAARYEGFARWIENCVTYFLVKLHGQSYQAVRQAKNELNALKDMYTDIDKQKKLQSEEISQIVNNYEWTAWKSKQSEKTLRNGFFGFEKL